MAVSIIGLEQLDVRLVVAVAHLQARHLDLFDELAFVGVDGIEPVHHMVFVEMGGGVAQRAQRVELCDRFAAFLGIRHALGFVDEVLEIYGLEVNSLEERKFLINFGSR